MKKLNIKDLYENELGQYYSGTQTTVFINNQYVEEAVAVGWNAIVNSSPLYSYNEELYNNIAKGVFRVEGKLIINYKATGYLQYLILKGDKQIGNENNAGIVPFALSHNGKHYNKNDRGDIIFDESKRRIEKYEFDKSKAGLSQAEYFDLKNNMKDYIWGSSNSDINGDNSPSAIRNALHDTTFDILIMYGNPNSDNYTIHTIVDAMVLNVSQDIANDGTPIYEVYQFIARDIDQPLFNEEDKRNFELYNGSSIYKPSMNEALSTLQTLMKNNLMDNIILPWKTMAHAGNDHVKVNFDKITNIFGGEKFVFDSDSSVYKEGLSDNKKMMNNIVNAMRKDKDIKILIEGHTDCAGDDTYNLNLSIARANAIKNALVNNYGIEEHRISTVGYGETQPIIDGLCNGNSYAGSNTKEINKTKKKAENNRRTVVKIFSTINLKPTKNNKYNLPFVDNSNNYCELVAKNITSYIPNLYKVSLNVTQAKMQLVQAHYSQNDYNGMQYKPTDTDIDYKIYPIAYTKKDSGGYLIDHGQEQKSSRALLAELAGIPSDEVDIKPYMDFDFMGPIDYDKIAPCDIGNTIHTVEIKEYIIDSDLLNSIDNINNMSNSIFTKQQSINLFTVDNNKEKNFNYDIKYDYIKSSNSTNTPTNAPYNELTYFAVRKKDQSEVTGFIINKAEITSEIDFTKIHNFNKMIKLNNIDVLTNKKVDFNKQTSTTAKRLDSDITLITTDPDYEKTRNNIIDNINAYVKELITLTDYFGQVNTISLFDIIIEAPNNTNIVNNINARLDTIVKPYVNIASAQSSELTGTVQFKPTKKFSSIYNEISMLENNKTTITTNYSSVISLDSYSNYMAIICNDDVNEVNTIVDNTIQNIIGAFAPLYSDINNNITGTTINTKYFNIQQVSNYYKNNTSLPTEESFVDFKIKLTGNEVKVINELNWTLNKYHKKTTLEEQLNADVYSSNPIYLFSKVHGKNLFMIPIEKFSNVSLMNKYGITSITDETMTYNFELLNSQTFSNYIALTTNDNITKYILDLLKNKQSITINLSEYVAPKLVDKSLLLDSFFAEVDLNENINRMPVLVFDFPTGTEYDNFRNADILLGEWDESSKNKITCTFTTNGTDRQVELNAQNTRIVRDNTKLYIIVESKVLLNTTTNRYEIPDHISNFKLYYAKETTLNITDSKKLPLYKSVVPEVIDGKKDKNDTTINYLFGNSLNNDANYVYNKDGTFNTKSKTNYNLNEFVPSYKLYMQNNVDVTSISIPAADEHFESVHLPFKNVKSNEILSYAATYVFLDDQPGSTLGDTTALNVTTIVPESSDMFNALNNTNINLNDPPYIMYTCLYTTKDHNNTPYEPKVINVNFSEITKLNNLNSKANYFILKDNSYNKLKNADRNIIPSFRAVINFDQMATHLMSKYKDELAALNLSNEQLAELLLEFTYQAYAEYNPQVSEYVGAAMPTHNLTKVNCNKMKDDKAKERCKIMLKTLPDVGNRNILLLEGLVSQGDYLWLTKKLKKNANITLYDKLDKILNNT